MEINYPEETASIFTFLFSSVFLTIKGKNIHFEKLFKSIIPKMEKSKNNSNNNI